MVGYGWFQTLFMFIISSLYTANDPKLTCAYFSYGLVQPPTNNGWLCWFAVAVEPGLDNDILISSLHPGRLTWNLQITHLERKMIFQTSIIVFHVYLPRCKLKPSPGTPHTCRTCAKDQFCGSQSLRKRSDEMGPITPLIGVK